MQTEHRGAGAFYAIAAYGIWGVAPLYFKWIGDVGPWQLIAHRILWTAILLLPLLWWLGGFGRLAAVLRERGRLLGLVVTALLIGTNWSVYIYAVLADRVLEASLGYFINPLVSLVLGMVFLGERLRPLQWIAVCVAAAGVGNEVMRFGEIPWLGLTLAFSFGFYGLLRKQLAVDSFTGLTVESWVLLPVACAYLFWNAATGTDAFTASASNATLLLLAGPVTMLPLLCFAAAATRLPLSSLGFFQYIAPTLQFGMAITVFGEVFHPGQWFTFVPIWVALLLFSVNALYVQRRQIFDEVRS